MSMCVNWDPSYGMNISLAWFKGSKNLKIALFSISTDSSTGKSNDYGDYCVNGEGSGSNGPRVNVIDCGGTADLKCTGGCLK